MEKYTVKSVRTVREACYTTVKANSPEEAIAKMVDGIKAFPELSSGGWEWDSQDDIDLCLLEAPRVLGVGEWAEYKNDDKDFVDEFVISTPAPETE